MYIFLNSHKKLKDIWWIAVFFFVLAAFTFPLVFISQHFGWEVSLTNQAVVIIFSTWISQALRRKSMSELLGKPDFTLIKNVLSGFAAGVMLMLLPVFCLTVLGHVHWQQGSGNFSSVLSSTGSFLAAAIAEEFLFRGFVFQRLRKASGFWIAQLIIAAFFLLIHLNNPGMTGNTRILASVNIFVASMMFGLAYAKTGSLIMPIAFHFMANWVQGPLLGFGVSGNEQASLFQPALYDVPDWLSGGKFGIEGSIPGLVFVFLITFILYQWRVPASAINSNKHP